MSKSVRISEITAVIALCLAVIALAMSLRSWTSQPKIVSVSVKSLIEEERDWLLAQNADERSAAIWIDTVAGEIETTLRGLEAQGYTVLVKEAVLAGDLPDLTETVRTSLGVRDQLTGSVSRSTNAQAVDPGIGAVRPGPGTTVNSYGDTLLAEAREGED
ncbi:MAG: TrbI F-type domain-containing protein [Pseudomonadota bacterium]